LVPLINIQNIAVQDSIFPNANTLKHYQFYIAYILLESVARAGTFTSGVSSNVKGTILCLDYLVVVGYNLIQHEIKSQPLDVTYLSQCLIKSPLSDLDLEKKI
jgi:hypothetical protein